MPRPPTDRHWLSSERLRLYSLVFLALGLAPSVRQLYAWRTSVLDNDFIVFWASSWLGLHGRAAAAYDMTALQQVVHMANSGIQPGYAWMYPPAHLLLLLPLALLPLVAAYLVYMLIGLAAYVATLRRVLGGITAWMCVAAFPGLWVNLYVGQNGFLTAALAASALLTLPRRPLLGGAIVGLVAIKPQLALGFLPALLAIGAWPSLLAAAVSAIASNALAAVVLGPGVLPASVVAMRQASQHLAAGWFPLQKMPTVFAALRLHGVPLPLALSLHAGVAAVALLVLWRVWRRCQDWELRAAALMSASLLFSPYLYHYDLAWLAFPIAWMSVAGSREGWLRGEREILLAAWLLPLLMAVVMMFPATFHWVQPGPPILLLLLWAIARRAGKKKGQASLH